MKVKVFDSYKMPEITKAEFIRELIDNFTNCEFFGYKSDGTTYYEKDETLYIYLYKGNDEKTIKLDLSDLGVEIGTQVWDEGEPTEFIPEINLDSNSTKQVKSYKVDIKKFNV